MNIAHLFFSSFPFWLYFCGVCFWCLCTFAIVKLYFSENIFERKINKKKQNKRQYKKITHEKYGLKRAKRIEHKVIGWLPAHTHTQAIACIRLCISTAKELITVRRTTTLEAQSHFRRLRIEKQNKNKQETHLERLRSNTIHGISTHTKATDRLMMFTYVCCTTTIGSEKSNLLVNEPSQ